MLDLTPEFMSDAVRKYGKNIIQHYHDSIRISIPWSLQTQQGVPVPMRGQGRIGIIGGGVGGLYAAMLLQDQGIPFEILEASGHTGGRLFTYKFSEDKYDYYDVGAMRFPKTPLMDPVFKLFDRLGIKEGGRLVPYIFQTSNSTLFYNSILKERSEVTGKAEDFGNMEIPEDYRAYAWTKLVNNVVEPFAKELAEDVKTGGDSGWKLMMEYDQYSMKAYMAGNRSDTQSKLRPDVDLDELKKMPYPMSVVNWCETFDKSTGWYDRALSETVIESLAFAWPDKETDQDIKWFCVDGGSSVISDEMVKNLNLTIGEDLMLNSRVIGIRQVPNEIEVTLADGSTRRYDHVINTATLPCLRTMDLTNAGLDYLQMACLRQLQYGPATKIGIKFKSAWWEDPKVMGKFGPIIGGQSFTDNIARTVVYPSYGAHGKEPGAKSTVLIASYAWTEDAITLSALMGPDPESKAVLKRRILQDLVAIHGFDPNDGHKFLESEYVDSFPFSWNNNLYTMGAFGFFEPGNFAEIYRNLTRPAASGRLHFAGEAVSDRHAWVVGALHASKRAVDEILNSSLPPASARMEELEKKWGWFDGKNLELSSEDIMRQVAISLSGVFQAQAKRV